MRLGNRLEIHWLASLEASRWLVPQMILLPLVENAIRHGIAPVSYTHLDVYKRQGSGVVATVDSYTTVM